MKPYIPKVTRNSGTNMMIKIPVKHEPDCELYNVNLPARNY